MNQKSYKKIGIIGPILLLISICVNIPLWAQSPSDLNSDIAASHGFNTVSNIEASFNNARRQEEIQLSLGTNAISDLTMPDQMTWDNMNQDAQILYLLNDERTARAGVNYGAGSVLGLPFEGVGTNLDMASQNHSEDLLTNNGFAHCYPAPTNCPEDRVDAAVGASCQGFVPYIENLYEQRYSVPGSSFPNSPAESIYGWNYDDAGSAWGHRRMNLYQGFTDDYGDNGKEGIIGVGYIEGPYLGWASGVVITLNYFDPVASCSETLLLDTDDLPGVCGNDLLTLNNTIPSETYTSDLIKTDGLVPEYGDVILEITVSAEMMPNFQVDDEGVFTINVLDCN